uniref:Secreted protein n=1 Tax=Steinernema glaseri TaxID=37863 RepID=A0A1I8A2E7_9BILA
MVFLLPLLLLLMVSAGCADQEAWNVEASYLIGNVTNLQRNGQRPERGDADLFSDEVMTDDQYQKIMSMLVKTVAKAADALIPIPVLNKIASAIASSVETQKPDELKKLANIEKLLKGGFSILVRSVDNAVNSVKCGQAINTYKMLHRHPAGQAMRNLKALSKTRQSKKRLNKKGRNGLDEFKTACDRMGYSTALGDFTATLSEGKTSFGTACLVDQMYSYKALLEIKRVIKVDAIILGQRDRALQALPKAQKKAKIGRHTRKKIDLK